MKKEYLLSAKLIQLFFIAIFMLLTFHVFAQQNCVPKPLGLIHWWDGDDVSGSTTKDIIGGMDGTLVNAQIGPGFVGNAFIFSGYVETPVYLDFTTGITFDLWIKTNDNSGFLAGDGGGATLLNGMALFIENNGKIGLCSSRAIDSNPNFMILGPIVNDGLFHHIAATWTGDVSANGANLYIDGVLVGSATALQALGQINSANDRPFCLGWNNFISAGSQYHKYEGMIDEVKIYNRALTSQEISAIYNAGFAGTCKVDVPVNPAAPIATDANFVTYSGFSANWYASAGATEYFIDVSENIYFTAILPYYNNLPVGNVTTFTISGLTEGSIYYYRVRAVNAGGTSDNSNVVEVKTNITPPVTNYDCGKNKVLVCHKGIEICISKNALNAHLNHGDVCGPCHQAKLKSGIISTSSGLSAELKVYNNPANNYLSFELPGHIKDISVIITSINGQILINSGKLSGNRHQIDTFGLAPGIYLMNVTDNAGFIYQGKFIKAK